LRQRGFSLHEDRDFEAVIRRLRGAAQPQPGHLDHPEMKRRLRALHQRGIAHSYEIWRRGDALVGGLYGVRLGSVFFGESMFSLGGATPPRRRWRALWPAAKRWASN
jgi:leucyl/phenylalanyl-tRNA--protein transferase